MSFLQPILLFGLPLIALPIIIHLINKWRHRSIQWGAMMFLLDAKRMTRGMARLRFWLIMLMRMLAIAVLFIAVARPLTTGWLGVTIGAQADTTIILLDRSASMEQVDLQSRRSKRIAGPAPDQPQRPPLLLARANDGEEYAVVGAAQLARLGAHLRPDRGQAAWRAGGIDHGDFLDRRGAHDGAPQRLGVDVGAACEAPGADRLERGDRLPDAPFGACDRALRGEPHLVGRLTLDIGVEAVQNHRDRYAGREGTDDNGEIGAQPAGHEDLSVSLPKLAMLCASRAARFGIETMTNLRVTVKAVLRHDNFLQMELARHQRLMHR